MMEERKRKANRPNLRPRARNRRVGSGPSLFPAPGAKPLALPIILERRASRIQTMILNPDLGRTTAIAARSQEKRAGALAAKIRTKIGNTAVAENQSIEAAVAKRRGDRRIPVRVIIQIRFLNQTSCVIDILQKRGIENRLPKTKKNESPAGLANEAPSTRKKSWPHLNPTLHQGKVRHNILESFKINRYE